MRKARVAPRAAPTVRTAHGQYPLPPSPHTHPSTHAAIRCHIPPYPPYPLQVRTEHGQYTGQWRDGCQHGSGAARYQDGAHYKGEWVQGVASGAGRLRLPNRDVYEGETCCLSTHYYSLLTTHYSLLGWYHVPRTSLIATCTKTTSVKVR